MTLAETKQEFIEKARRFFHKEGSIALMPEDDGTVDIGNGYFVSMQDAEALIMDAI